MKYFITGISGMVGAHLSRHLWTLGHEVHGFVRTKSKSQVLLAHEWSSIKKYQGDLVDLQSILTALEEAKPDCIVHLGAQSHVPSSHASPMATMLPNVDGTMNLLEAVRSVTPKSRVLLAGSSEEYGLVEPEECPITEAQPLRPLSQYGVSKVATDLLGYQYWRSYKLHVIRARAFNHCGPGRLPLFAEGTFADQAVRVSRNLQKEIRHGNLDAIRDYTDVRDTVRAYVDLLDKGTPGDAYNIASGKGHSMHEVLQASLAAAGVKDAKLVLDTSRIRPSDVPLLIGDATKLNKLTGWYPRISFDKMIADIVEWYRDR